MPLIRNEQVGDNSKLYLWLMEENEDAQLADIPVPEKIKHPQKIQEYKTSRKMMMDAIPDFDLTLLRSSEYGKPYLSNSDIEISLSHSYPYVALLTSDEAVGIDIQRYEDKMLRIATRFTSEKEVDMQNLEEVTAVWCIKEAVFKWYEKGKLEFISQIQLPKINFDDPRHDVHLVTIDGEEIALNSHYELHEDYALAYVWSK